MKVVIAVLVTTLVVGAARATAGSLITGRQIANNSITGKDVKRKELE